MAVNLSPFGGVGVQFFDNSGNPLTGGKIFTYTAGTTTPQTTYTTSAGSTAHSNPIILDAGGRVPNGGEIWLTDGLQYKFLLKDANDVQIASYDNIVGINSNFVSFTNEQEIITATAGQTVFNLSISYQPGTNSLSVFVDGVNQYGPGAQYAYVETDSDTVTFTNGLHVGAEVKFTTSQLNSSGSTDASLVTYDPPFSGGVATNVEEKLSQTISVKDFGAVGDGVTNDRNAIQAALDYASSLGGAIVWFPPATAYKLNSGITIDTSTTIVNFGGNKIDFSGMASGNALNITRSENDPNLQNSYNHVHMVSNGSLFGPGGNNGNLIAFNFNNVGNAISGGIVSYMALINFGKDVYFGDGAFCIEFHHCNFTLTSGTPATYSINAPSGVTNAGERLNFIGCMWNNRDFVLNHANPNGNMFFVDCSFDYSSTRVMTVSSGAVYITASHIEQSSDNDAWFVVDPNENAKLSLHQCDIISQFVGTKTYPYFYCQNTCTSHGVIIKDCRISGIGVPEMLIGGSGRTDVSGAKFDTVFGNRPISLHQNTLAYPSFESANYTAEWSLANGAIRSNAQAHTGSWSLSFPASTGVEPAATTSAICNSTQSVSGEFWYKVTGITGTGGTFYATISYLDQGNNQLFGGVVVAVTTNVNNWTKVLFTTQVLTPPGTAKVQLLVQIFGTTSGTPTAYIDDVLINVT